MFNDTRYRIQDLNIQVAFNRNQEQDYFRFPLQVLESDYLDLAIQDFKKMVRQVKRITQWPRVKKCFVYLLWMYFGLRFKSKCTFL